MKIHLMQGCSPRGFATFGGYWPRGLVHADSFELYTAQGTAVPVQSEITARWPDGSVKWSRHTASAELLGTQGELLPGQRQIPQGLAVQENGDSWTVCGEHFHLTIPRNGPYLARDCFRNGIKAFERVFPVLRLSHSTETEWRTTVEIRSLPAVIRERTLEAAGPQEAVFRFDGCHEEDGKDKMPFRIRMSVFADGELRFDDTLFFQGDPLTDRLAGWGLHFDTVLKGASYQRHIRFLTDEAVYHDAPTQLFHWKKRLDPALLAAQFRGETVAVSRELDDAAADLPRWDHFFLTQDSAWHYVIRKKAWEGGCWLDGVQGRRAPGGMAVSDPERTLSFHIREFWEKHPAGLETECLSGEETACTAWFYSPQAEPFDFRHYDCRSYPMGNYEGFEYMRPDPVGVAVTCRLVVHARSGFCPNEDLQLQNKLVRCPPIYLADPEYYHTHQAFGCWSLPQRDTEVSAWMERQMEDACAFYLREREARSWYGLFNYGDLMHTYEACRHMWRWDVGGYAWDNTELVPTYWLWLQFLRTGNPQVFALAEALSRHAADVDMYHFGSMKGLGSRHNVRHWGCPCKEPRISMAGHHRPLYYLTGDRRIGDCMEDSLDAAGSLAAMPWFLRKDGRVRVRSGPDWAAIVSNWMTAYERTLDPLWRARIETGIADLKKAPLGLASGPVFVFDPESGHLFYEGELPGSMHLQACMGGPEIWLETASMLGSADLAEMAAEDGRYFFMTPEESVSASGNLLQGRSFGSPIYSAELQAWAARSAKDPIMARRVWVRLLSLLYRQDHPDGYLPVAYSARDDGTALEEIPWITTNFTAQWCLKTIVCLDLIPDSLPGTFRELNDELLASPPAWRLYGA